MNDENKVEDINIKNDSNSKKEKNIATRKQC